ncbi:MAG: hypothetical protein QS748_07105 [Candidatus Endonucleobacter bathymodioli]|uniref:Uncharacterized protein n=1 Tax=Candidatus Endonucleibacter bathymodioli TaxID=539814 RepID=A0AA90SXV4_9GAMM|nr:hypothetical protein [Candidatus Endonucleobacter bathymodioli]
MLIALVHFSEEFYDKNLWQVADYLGLVDPKKNSLRFSGVRYPDYILETQNDLENAFDMIMFFANDIERKASKMIQDEDPYVGFLSVAEHSIHSLNTDIKESVSARINKLRGMALDKSLSPKDRMYATLDYVMQKANAIVIHSDTRNSVLGFEENSFIGH